jgi:hypothetical protein
VTEDAFEALNDSLNDVGGAVEALGSNLPIIRIKAGKLTEIIDAAEKALLDIGADLYQRGGAVVRAITAKFKTDSGEDYGLRSVLVEPAHVVERMTGAARWQKFDDRRGKDDKWVAADCPSRIAEMYLARKQWGLRPLTGIITAPTLRADGSILDKAGYDKETGLLFEPCGVKFPAIPSSPRLTEAEAALVQLTDLLSTFYFVDEVDKAVALSGILTALVRRSLPAAPLHAFTAPVAGAAKTKLINLTSVIATGKKAPVIAQGRTEEEMEKRLGAALVAGDSIISIDNCTLALAGDFLCQAVTEETVKVRILGQSRQIDAPSNACLFATGNNLVIAGDMTRRTLLCSLDPKVEQPELLVFPTDVLQMARENRGAYVAAALTIMRAHHVVDPFERPAPLGSFERWSRMVRDALVWLGLPDPCGTIEKTRAKDPQYTSLRAVVRQWHSAMRTATVSVQQLIEKANEVTDLKEALAAVAGTDGSISNRRLGKYLGKSEGRIVTIGEGPTRVRARVVQEGAVGGSAKWRLEEMPAAEPKSLT